MTEDGEPYGPARYKEIAKERYLISKHTNTSYEDTALISPVERGYILEFLVEDMERQKEMYERVQAEAEQRRKGRGR